MGGAATTKTLIQNYSALENVLWAGAACVCCMLRTVTPAARHGTSHPVPTAGPAAAVRTAQQSTEKCKVLRPHCQGKATRFQGGGVLHCKPLGRDACKHKLGNEADVGDCGQLEHPHFPVSHVGRHSILNPVPPTGQCREGSVVHPPSCRSHPAQHRVPWQGDRACASPTASQQSSPRKSISAHPPPPPCSCPTCPALWPKLSACLIPALSHSFTLCVRKETAHLPNQLSQRESSNFY